MIPFRFRNNTILLFLKLSFKNPRAHVLTLLRAWRGAELEMCVLEREQLGGLLPRARTVP